VESMAATVWRFGGTEGADEAVLKLRHLEAAKIVEVQDVAVVRWPQYAAEPTVREHVTEEGTKVSSLMHKFTHAGIESSMIESAKGDMTQGTSALVSDLSVQEQDRLRAASADTAEP
jgi:uncharacterized membrane protein